MPRTALRVAARLAGVIGIVGALVLPGTDAGAVDTISLTDCTSPSPTASSGPTAPPGSTAEPEPTDTPQNCVPPSGSIIRDVRTLQFSVSTDTFRSWVSEVVATLVSQTNGVASPGPVPLNCPTADEDTSAAGCQSNNSRPNSGVYTFEWDSGVITPSNGVYTFRVDAKFSNGVNSPRSQSRSRTNLIVDNPPVQPNKPQIVVATSSSVSLVWDANPEPDLSGYVVQRAVTKDNKTPPAEKDFAQRAVTSDPSLRDQVSGPGAYWYRVQAGRKSYNPSGNGFILSSWSDTSSAAVVGGPTSTPSAGKPRARRVGGTVRALPPSLSARLTPPGLIPSVAAAPPPVPDAPYSAYLPYGSSDAAQEEAGPPAPEPGVPDDPRGAVLPVAVGAFLVTSALALGRMPF